MRRSREDAAATRRDIVNIASRLFRERGISSVSVADIMGALGLTVGGFYRHFVSKEALISEAIELASLETSSHHSSLSGATKEERSEASLDLYLSSFHRDHPALGCPVAALCSEIAYQSSPTKEAFTKALGRLLSVVRSLVPGGSKTRDRHLQTAASLVGAVVLARATSDKELSDELLSAVRRGVLAGDK